MLRADQYKSGNPGDDDQTMYGGFNNDICRSTYKGHGSPRQDTPGYEAPIFGSAHAAGFNAVLCDGSVHTIPYSVDLEMHRRLGNRNDGLPVEGVLN
ncbi:MAG: DUF1559 domain-containing protein [Pirellulales bacterium]